MLKKKKRRFWFDAPVIPEATHKDYQAARRSSDPVEHMRKQELIDLDFVQFLLTGRRKRRK